MNVDEDGLDQSLQQLDRHAFAGQNLVDVLLLQALTDEFGE